MRDTSEWVRGAARTGSRAALGLDPLLAGEISDSSELRHLAR